MNSTTPNNPRVLAIAPCVQGIGYIVFTDPRSPIDWGVKWTRHEKNVNGLAKVSALINRYNPGVVVIEDAYGSGAKRSQRIKDLLDDIAALVSSRGIRIALYSRDRVRQTFARDDAVTKYQIAKVIGEQIPELAPRLPVERKIWLPEHANMSIFDAASLALTYFTTQSPEDVDLEQAA